MTGQAVQKPTTEKRREGCIPKSILPYVCLSHRLEISQSNRRGSKGRKSKERGRTAKIKEKGAYSTAHDCFFFSFFFLKHLEGKLCGEVIQYLSNIRGCCKLIRPCIAAPSSKTEATLYPFLQTGDWHHLSFSFYIKLKISNILELNARSEHLSMESRTFSFRWERVLQADQQSTLHFGYLVRR